MERDRKQTGALIDTALYRRMKSLAVLQDRRVGELIDEALRDYLARHRTPMVRTKPPAKSNG